MNPVFTVDCLQGQTLLITGASSGLGRDAAMALAGCGARLVLAGRDADRLAAAQAALPGAGHGIEVADLSDADAAADWVKGVATRLGGLNGIFHAAGIELVRPVRLSKQAQIDEVFASSLMAALGIARAAAQKNVMADGASLVFMSSVAGQRGTAGMAVYSAAKAAIDGMVRSLACELAPRAIRVNALAAGAVVTAMHSRLTATLGPDAVADYEKKHLLGFGKPDDVSQAAMFLLSPASRWITGTTLVVDGGYMVR